MLVERNAFDFALERTKKIGSPTTSFEDTVTSTEEDTTSLTEAKKRTSKNVWYRHVVKPFIRENRPPSYRQAFQRRIVKQAGIPVAQLNGLHEVFLPSFLQYSPLIGMIFAHNHFVDNLYRYGNPQQEVAVRLIRLLFHILPGGEIQPTHASRNASAYLSPGLVGTIFEEWEAFQETSFDESDRDQEQLWISKLYQVISQHPDHEKSLQSTVQAARNAKKDLDDVENRDKESKNIRAEIKRLEGDVVKHHRHALKRLEKQLLKVDENGAKRLQEEIAECETMITQGIAEIDALRSHIVTSADKKAARKALKRAEEAVDLEKQSLSDLSHQLGLCFFAYDRHSSSLTTLPKYCTTAILLSFLWRKYDDISALLQYFESMERLHAIDCSTEKVKQLMETAGDADTLVSERNQKRSIALLRSRPVWDSKQVSHAAEIVTGKPGSFDRSPIIPFSYITWAAYSEFPDCGETAIRNLLNQMFFNPETSTFDHQLLTELREKFYPRLSSRLISFYQLHPKPQDATEQHVALEWIDVVSHLNGGCQHKDPSAPFIRYRREYEEKNIASPLSNLVRVFNALLGLGPVADTENIIKLVTHINELRPAFKLAVDVSRVKKDGFGILGLSASDTRYELQSYKPVHFGFIQVATSQAQSSSSYEFKVFHKLMRHTVSASPRWTPDELPFLEQLALASMYVPYKLERSKIGRFFQETQSLDYVLLFADLDVNSSKQAAIKWATSHGGENEVLDGLVERILTYKEPKFGPQKGEKPGLEKQLMKGKNDA